MSGYLEELAGVSINGNKPFDIQVNNWRFYRDVFCKGALGLGESYVNCHWDVEDLYAFHVKVLTSPMVRRVSGSIWPVDWLNLIKEKFSFVSPRKAKSNISFHYDIGNQFYEIMLGKTMQYTSAYFSTDAKDLQQAQKKKFELVAQKLRVFDGCTVLEIGCGWGVFAKYLAEERGCHVVAITVSQDQHQYCLEKSEILGKGSVRYILADFRETDKFSHYGSNGQFDRIVGVGTIAHFVPMFRSFVNILYRHLMDGGLALIDDVCRDITCKRLVPSQSSWTCKYIFPGTQFFSPDTIAKFFRNKFIIEQWNSDRSQYRDTCLAWLSNIEAEWQQIVRMGFFDEKFLRIWRYYLTSAAAGFESGFLGQWQILLSKMSHPYRENSRVCYYAAPGGSSG